MIILSLKLNLFLSHQSEIKPGSNKYCQTDQTVQGKKGHLDTGQVFRVDYQVLIKKGSGGQAYAKIEEESKCLVNARPEEQRKSGQMKEYSQFECPFPAKF